MISNDSLSLKTDVNVPTEITVIRKQIRKKTYFLLASWMSLSTDEKIRIPIRICKSSVQIQGSGSVPKFHGSGTLVKSQIYSVYVVFILVFPKVANIHRSGNEK